MTRIVNILIIGIGSFITINLTSCSEKQPTQDEIVKKNIEELMVAQMNDPESYEFVKIELLDSVLYSDNIEFRRKHFQRELYGDQGTLITQEEYKTQFPILYDKRKVQELKEQIEKNERILFKIDSLETQLGNRKKEVASYTYIFSFRGKNSFGAKILNEYVLQTDPAPHFKIINFTDDKEKIYLNPNEFPGYKEMINDNL
jgi:hypothetical protein